MVRYGTTSKDVLVADIVAIQDWKGFDSLASYLETEHGARPIEQLDGPESPIWKFEIDGKVIALHNNPDGNYFKAIGKESQDVLKIVIEDLERRLSGTEISNPADEDAFRTLVSSPQRVLMPHTLLGEWNLLDQYPDPILADLIARYSEPSRHYHTLAHVRALLSHLSRHQALASDLPAITAAILYHDAVYDTRRNDNEARSAELASHDLSALRWPRASTDKVIAMILATQHHNPPQPDADTLLFLDLDLSILGAQAEHYAAYSAVVRREFEWVPETVYKQGRSRVLTGFLARETIFRTPALITLWEENARINLTNELSALAADAQS